LLFANLPDEFLRYDGTAQLVNRLTEATVEVGGVTRSDRSPDNRAKLYRRIRTTVERPGLTAPA